MSDGFAEMIGTAQSFFAELAANNSKEWFEPRKEVYASQIKRPAELLASLVADDLTRLTGRPHAAKVHRIHRDVRFSKDKSPYNAHLHILWSAGEGVPGWFLAVEPKGSSYSVGRPDLDAPALDRYRRLVDARGAEMAAALAAAEGATGAALADWGAGLLKKVPKPHPEDHPQADLLRRKSLVLTAPLAPGWEGEGVVAVLSRLSGLLFPVWRLLDDGLRP
jgi:uncharacterized protein (TIGR02453 family)